MVQADCLRSTTGLVLGYLAVVIVGSLLYAVHFVLGLMALSVGPPLFLIGYFACVVYRPQVLKRQAVFTATEAIGMMLPLLLIVMPVGLVIAQLPGLEGVGSASPDEAEAQSPGFTFQGLLAAFITAFFLAALPEELLKLLAVWRLVPEVPDPRSLVVYAMAAAAGFAGIENIMYLTASASPVTGIMRAALAVPGHVVCGALTGGHLAGDRFLGGSPNPCDTSSKLPSLQYAGKVLFAPVMQHGFYNFLMMVSAQSSVDGIRATCIMGAIAVDLVGLFLAREYTRRLAVVPPVDVQELLKAGSVPRPRLHCCLGRCVCGGGGGGPAKGAPSVAKSGVIGRPIEGGQDRTVVIV
jgi:RsiW-degrading membrane proteinase PrsW (M82 family)